VPSVFALVFWDYDTNYLTHLNDDMQVKIASYLRNHGFLMLRLTCKHYYAFGLKRGDIIVGDNYIPYNQLDVSSNDSITDISAYTSLSYDHTTKRIDNTQRPLPLGALRSLARFPHANGKCRKWKILLEKGIKLSTFTAVTEKDVSNQNYIIGDLIIVEETPINQFIEVNRSVCMITLIKPFQVMRKVNLLLDGLNMRSCASWTSLNMIHYWNADNVIIYWTNTNNIKIVTSCMFSTLCSVSHCGRRIDMTYFHDEEYSPTFKRALTKNALFPMRYHVSHPHLRMSENALKSYDERDVFGINSVWNQ
jgi:hypothetical protein